MNTVNLIQLQVLVGHGLYCSTGLDQLLSGITAAALLKLKTNKDYVAVREVHSTPPLKSVMLLSKIPLMLSCSSERNTSKERPGLQTASPCVQVRSKVTIQTPNASAFAQSLNLACF